MVAHSIQTAPQSLQPVPQIDQIKSLLEQVWQVLDGQPNAQLTLETAFQQMEELNDRKNILLKHLEEKLTTTYDELRKARERSVESVIAEMTVEFDIEASTGRVFLEILKGYYGGFLGKARMLELEDYIQELAGDVYDYQNQTEADNDDDDFDPEDNYQ